MKRRHSFLAMSAATGLALVGIMAVSAHADQPGTAGEELIVPAARPTPPATRPLDPAGARDRAREPAAARHPREIPMVEADPAYFIQNASELMNQEVVTTLGQHLGTVEDLVVDVNSGQIAFLAVGDDGRLRPVPPQAFRPRPDEGILILDIERERWDRAPTVERGQLAGLAPEREARRIYRYYDQDYTEAVAQAGTPDVRDELYGAPPRWQQRHAPELDRLPGDPAIPRTQPRALPPDRTEVHPELRWEREYGIPRERGARERALEDQRPERTPEFGARAPREAAGPSLRNPRLHQSHRGTQRIPFGMEETAPEFGVPPARRDPGAAPRGRVPHEERLEWASEILGQRAADRAGEPLGEVSDLIVDLYRGRVQHVVVNYERPQPQQFAIPVDDIEIDQDRRVYVRPDAEMLRDAPRYEAREARLQPHRAFRYEERTREFGVPDREPPEEDVERRL